jgi:alpha-glucosidase
MDVVGLLMKDAELRDNPPNPDAPPGLAPNDIFGRQLHKYTQDLDEIHPIMQDFRRLLDSYGEKCAIGELWFELPRWVKYYGENGDGLHLPFNFRLKDVPWEAGAVRQSVDELEAALPEFGWPNYVLGSHDFPRLASRIGQAGARLAAMLLLTLRGTPTLYNGDEIGMENGIIPLNKIQDPQGLILGPERTRDVTRTPVQWDATPQAGFSTVEPWLPVSADYQTRNVAAQMEDPTSVLNLYRRLLWIRRRDPALQWGRYEPLDMNGGDVYAYLRAEGGQRRLIVLNFGEKELRVRVPGFDSATVLLSTYLDREETVQLADLQLRPSEGLLIKL